MSTISNAKRRLEEVTQKIKVLQDELRALFVEKHKLIQDIQNTCSHPIEYQDDIWTNTEKDPLESKEYSLECLACGKILEKYSMVNGHKVPRKEKDEYWL